MIKIHEDFQQGTPEWLSARKGVLTASNIKQLVTPKTKKIANNEDVRLYAYQMIAERNTDFLEDNFMSYNMEQGHLNEVYARDHYSEHYAEVKEVAFITNDKYGFKMGYSPDGLVGDDGLIEIKSRLSKFQVKHIIDGVTPDEFKIQCQTGLLVSEREWIDFISYSGGLPMFVIRSFPDFELQEKIIEACTLFENTVSELSKKYNENKKKYYMTEKRETEEITL